MKAVKSLHRLVLAGGPIQKHDLHLKVGTDYEESPVFERDLYDDSLIIVLKTDKP